MARPVVNTSCLFLFLCLPATALYSQEESPMLYKEIQLSHRSYTLHALTREIQQQTGVTFSYNASRISANQKIRLKSDRLTVADLLTRLKKQTGIGYKTVGKNHIIYTEAPAAKKIVAKKEKEKKTLRIKSSINPPNNKSQLPLPKDPAIHQIVIVGDSSAASFYFSGGSGYGGAYAGNSQQKPSFVINYDHGQWIDEERWHDPYAKLDGSFHKADGLNEYQIVSFLKRNTLVGIGFSTDELYYFNPQIRVGFDFLYGTASYNIGAFPHFRFGIGTSVSLNEKWSLHFNANTGAAQSSSFIASTMDTIPGQDTFGNPTLVERNTPFIVQSKLNRFTLSFSRDINRRFSIGAGLTFNQLKTSYTSNGKPVALSDILPVGMDADQNYRSIKPPYLLGNTYSGNTSSNTKTWIGVQLSFIYRLNFFAID